MKAIITSRINKSKDSKEEEQQEQQQKSRRINCKGLLKIRSARKERFQILLELQVYF